MKIKKKRVFQDERTIQMEQKLGNEIAFLAVILLLTSIFIKMTFLHLSIAAYLLEIVIIVGMELYALIRSWKLGLAIRQYDSEKGLKSRLVNGFTVAFIILSASFVGKFSKIQLYLNQHSILKFLVILVTIALVSCLLDRGVDWLNIKRQRQLEKELEE
ncbi:DUF6773 family protein [Streptococcus intermedius]|uniref:DUF6773 family protein n=1 Tax=Streptococcus intermedius TaxID=1338 RepID=UPI000F68E38B|nr:DUF6773 family protein [Streptococcus intermedius]RSJ25047.1 hypothetical protein D8826_08935 [Streptococcus intermedius]